MLSLAMVPVALWHTDGVLAEELQLQPIGNFVHGSEGASEIAAYDAARRRLLVINGEHDALDMLDLHDPRSPKLWRRVDLRSYGEVVTSVATNGKYIAVCICRAQHGQPGCVALLDTAGQPMTTIPVGQHPDMLTFTPSGEQLLVANEGEPGDDYAVDPAGSVTVIRLLPDGKWDSTELGFQTWDQRLLADSVRVFGPNASPANDFEPEYIAVSSDGLRAWVTLQENNAIAVVDLETPAIVDVVGLGFKDHSQPGNGLDASDADHAAHVANFPVYGMYQPDAIAAFEHAGQPFLITANEGDVREYGGFVETARVAQLHLDPATFPDAAKLQQPDQIGNLQVTRTLGDDNHDGQFERLFAFGGRSFAIWDASVKLVYDSGDLLEQISMQRFPTAFNSNHDASTFDQRSPLRGPEPEGVVIGQVAQRTVAFLGLERPSALVAIDVSSPLQPTVCGVHHATMPAFRGNASLAADRGPEGLCFIPASASPTGHPLLAVCFEVSGNTRIFEVR